MGETGAGGGAGGRDGDHVAGGEECDGARGSEEEASKGWAGGGEQCCAQFPAVAFSTFSRPHQRRPQTPARVPGPLTGPITPRPAAPAAAAAAVLSLPRRPSLLTTFLMTMALILTSAFSMTSRLNPPLSFFLS